MWLFTEEGFFSIVRKGRREWHVRARVVEDLHRLLSRIPSLPAPEVSYPGSDYPWRMIINGRQKAALFKSLAKIGYSNFKGQVGIDPDQRARLPVYHEVWRLMATSNLVEAREA